MSSKYSNQLSYASGTFTLYHIFSEKAIPFSKFLLEIEKIFAQLWGLYKIKLIPVIEHFFGREKLHRRA